MQGWTKIPLVDEAAVHHAGDCVEGLHFSSASTGFISTFSPLDQGAVFGVSGATTSVVVSGSGATKHQFGALSSTKSGELICSTDTTDVFIANGGPFGASAVPMGTGPDPHSAVTGFGYDGTGYFLLTGSALGLQLYKASSAPASGTMWTPVTTTCDTSGGQLDWGAAPQYPLPYLAVGGTTVAYASPASVSVCVSKAGGTFQSVTLTPAPAAISAPALAAIAFADANTGVVIGGDGLGNPAYVYYTADATTWQAATTLPATADASKNTKLKAVFFAPNSKTGWIVGGSGVNKDPTSTALLWKTIDGGKTWTDQSASLGMAPDLGTTAGKTFWVGYSLDANNLWVGGQDGVVLYNGSGGN
jgi:hypothetical protein